MLADIIAVFSGLATGVFYDDKHRRVDIGNSVMVQMPTGTGKTVVMAAVVKWFLETQEGDVWIIAHRRELVDQARQTVDRFLHSFGFARQAPRVKVYSVQWLGRHLAELAAEPVGFLIVDEAHHAVADSYQDIFSAFRPALKMGMTATPAVCAASRSPASSPTFSSPRPPASSSSKATSPPTTMWWWANTPSTSSRSTP